MTTSFVHDSYVMLPLSDSLSITDTVLLFIEVIGGSAGRLNRFFLLFRHSRFVGLLELFGVVHCFIYENFKSNWIWVCI